VHSYLVLVEITAVGGRFIGATVRLGAKLRR